MKLALIILCPLLMVSLACNLWLDWRLQIAHDRRPAGRFLRLRRDLPIYARGKNEKVVTLPAGLLVQESTPHGAATLGKVHGDEFLLVIHSEGDLKDAFEAAYKNTGRGFWAPFSFNSNDENMFGEPPFDDPDAGRSN